MKTYSPKQPDIKHEWLLVDVKGKTLGKVATKIADLLRGKHKPTFSPHLDCGDFVVVINAKDIKLTGKKLVQKVYHHHSRFANGLKTESAGKLLLTKPERVIENAVAGMIPHNKLKKDILRKMKVYAGSEHKQEAQQPKPYEL
jgi:large subunit ribosomal protein L13